MNWLLLAEIIYGIILVLVCIRIIYDTQNNTKTLAYVLLVLFLPLLGIIIYFSVGINYRKRKIYSKKLIKDSALASKLKEDLYNYSTNIYTESITSVQQNKKLVQMLIKDITSPLTGNNSVKLLVNGEQKFPDVLEALLQAKKHIHIEYYIFEDDAIGQSIEKILIQKAQEGVEVRFIYDDFGSRTIRKKMVPRLRAAGVKAFPFHEIIFIAFANRLNYRNHRKIIVIDGNIGFVGGINVSDKYINQVSDAKKLFWRDTHLRIEGPGVSHLQYLFLCDWNFCANEKLEINDVFFPSNQSLEVKDNKIVQIAASGPDSDRPTIAYALLQSINLAEEEVLLTTPYFIPDESVHDALIVAALGGVKVKLLVPGVSDSKIVNAAAWSYYDDLLNAGVEIYLYEKGFVHAKTLVTDRKMAMVGTANVDYRSFDLNFEVNAIVYDEGIAGELADVFFNDIKDANKIDLIEWQNRPTIKQMAEKMARLLSPLL
ncbi:cardiolipin synthase [Flavobacterium sp. '19STA2R22 D10 B1']|uniref:cardiolipin synthase n=1 Tax=Flavobacterium aerium TaxID=3037261 RepID=UPI00278C802C|nr:cardiolipin synthase [Flavobacterium sp. '19STA2R22 D10 B1']